MTAHPTACPECGSQRVRVILTRPTRDYLHILRRRHCEACSHRWYTLQDAERPIAPTDFTWTSSAARGNHDFVLHKSALFS